MNTVQLECFVAVAEHLNFSKASRELNITQPAVTHQIQALEEELNVKLFTRTSRSVSLTQEGVLFLPDAQLMLRTAMSARERLGRQERFLPFELGCHNSMEVELLPEVLKKLLEEFPLLRPSIRMVPFPSLLGQVENSQLHCALGIGGARRSSALAFREVCTAPIACICAEGHPLSGYRTVTRSGLTGNMIACSPRQIPDSVFTVQNSIITGLDPEQRFFTENIESTLALVKAGLGYTLYPDVRPARKPGLCYIPVKNLPGVSFGVYYRYQQEEPVLKRFLSLFSSYMKEAQKTSRSGDAESK